MRRRGEKRTAGVAGAPPAAVIAFDEMWTYRQVRRRGKRQGVWVWTAVVEEGDGSRWADFEVVDRSEATFLRFYGMLPEAELPHGWLPGVRLAAGGSALGGQGGSGELE